MEAAAVANGAPVQIPRKMSLFDLPDCMLEQIFEYMSYDEIAKQRIVCTKFAQICQTMLNTGFNKMTTRHADFMKRLKAVLPRRESERRNHPLSKHVDILTCIDTRLSMVGLTYGKYMEAKLCCFIPGKVIDEIQKLMNILDSIDIRNPPPHLEEEPLRSHELLMELRDISSMAIDHFEEKIAPRLQDIITDVPPARRLFGTSSLHFQCKYLFAPQPANDYRQSTLDAMVCDYLDEENRFSTLFTKKPALLDELGLARPRRSASNTRGLSYRHYVQMDRKVSSVVRKLNSVVVRYKRQGLKLRNCNLQIAALNTQIVDLRRRFEEFTSQKSSSETNTNIDQGTPVIGSSKLPNVETIPPNASASTSTVVDSSKLQSTDVIPQKRSASSTEEESLGKRIRLDG